MSLADATTRMAMATRMAMTTIVMKWEARVSEQEEFLAIEDLTRELHRSRATVWSLIKRNGIQTYRLPPDRRTFVRRADLPTLKQPVPRGRPVAITMKRGGYRRAQQGRDGQ